MTLVRMVPASEMISSVTAKGISVVPLARVHDGKTYAYDLFGPQGARKFVSVWPDDLVDMSEIQPWLDAILFGLRVQVGHEILGILNEELYAVGCEDGWIDGKEAAAKRISLCASGWQPIETAPTDGTPILGWCLHEEDPYWDDDPDAEYPTRITTYAAHCEGMSHVDDGPHVLEWGGAVDDHPDDGGAYIPDWWFLRGSEFEVAANPTHWMQIPPAPHS